MKEINLEDLIALYNNLRDEISILKIHIENLQDSAVRYDDIDLYRCQCG